MPADRAALPDPANETARRQTVRRIGAVAGVILAVAVLYRLGTPHDFFDLKIYMRAMRWWADGNRLYDYVQPDRVQGELYFTYPPFTALLLRPFASIPLGATVVVFTALTVVAVAVTTWWLIMQAAFSDAVRPGAGQRGTGRDGRPRPGWFVAGLAVPLAFAVESTRETITFGQINMLLVVLILADLLFAVRQGSRWAGVGIGLATALKLFPGIFIIYLLGTRRWRAATMAAAMASVATLLSAAVAPDDSWRFWTHEVWATGRVGRTDYTGNQSLLGLLSRLSAPDQPNRLLWLVLVVAIAGYGLWRAARAARAGDELTGLTLTGLVGALVSPITWTHHVYWFIPAVVVLLDAGLRTGVADPAAAARTGSTMDSMTNPATRNRRRRRTLLTLTVALYAAIVYGVVSFYDWGFAPVPTDSPVEFLLRNLYVLLALALLVMLPARTAEPAVIVSGPRIQRRPSAPRRQRITPGTNGG